MKIAIVFGGRSVEHEVSILTGLHAAKHVIEPHKLKLVYLTRKNKFVIGKRNLDFYMREHRGSKKLPKCLLSADVVLNCCHGGVGEGGSLAGMLGVLGISHTGCNSIVAAQLMSKTMTRRILCEFGFDQPKYNQSDIVFPVIIKPDKLGSSIGISIAKNKEELKAAIELALTLDENYIVEEYLQNATEINCSAFFYGDKVWTSKVQVMEKDEILSFDKKYLENSGGFGKKGKLDSVEEHPLQNEIQRLTEEAYKLFGMSGVIRADFLVVEDKIYLNEVNTVPGFLCYPMWIASGVPYGVLIDMLVTQARDTKEPKLVTSYQSNVLETNRVLVE